MTHHDSSGSLQFPGVALRLSGRGESCEASMSRSDEEKCGRLMRTACRNVIGFWQLLQEPDVHRLDHVKRLQYRAYMIGSALHLADLVVRHEHALIHLRRAVGEPELGEEAKNALIKLATKD